MTTYLLLLLDLRTGGSMMIHSSSEVLKKESFDDIGDGTLDSVDDEVDDGLALWVGLITGDGTGGTLT